MKLKEEINQIEEEQKDLLKRMKVLQSKQNILIDEYLRSDPTGWSIDKDIILNCFICKKEIKEEGYWLEMRNNEHKKLYSFCNGCGVSNFNKITYMLLEEKDNEIR